MLQALETRWKGYRFRSRTEARWAVFLEAAGFSFEYEPEAYVLPSGPYLPDFKIRLFERRPSGITERSLFLEIKGAPPSEREIQRCAELVSASRKDAAPAAEVDVFIAVGAPDLRFGVFPVCVTDDGAAELDFVGYRFLASTAGEVAIEAEDPDWRGQPMVMGIGYRTHAEAARPPRPYGDYGPARPAWLRGAYDAARSARFEFGETAARWPT